MLHFNVGKTYRAWIVGMISLGLAPMAGAVENWDQLPTDRLLVTYKPQAILAARGSLASSSQTPALQRLALQRGAAAQPLRLVANGSQLVKLERPLDATALQAIIQTLINDPDVDHVEPDLRVFPAMIPDDPLYADQWPLWDLAGGVRVEDAWDISRGNGAVVAVLDTGVRPHADLVGNLLPGYDFVSIAFNGNDGDERDSDPTDPGDGVAVGECGGGLPKQAQPSSWHGTHVAGIVAASGFNAQGVTGVAPEAQILPLRVMGRCGGYTSDVVDAIYWAVGETVAEVPANPTPARVINLSLSSQQTAACSRAYADAIALARSKGALVVVAAGNNQGNADLYPPGNCASAFTVAAVQRNGGRAVYSNVGAMVEIAAPGGQMAVYGDTNGILSTADTGLTAPEADDYLFYQGTSMAAPHVSGVAALLVSANPQASITRLESVLRASARPFPATCMGCGAGIVNAALAAGMMTGQVDITAQADIKLVLKGANGKFVKDPADPTQGSVQYLAEISNKGPEIATEVYLTNALPPGTVLDTISTSKGSCSGVGLCDLGDLAVGEKVSVSLRVLTANKKKMDFLAQVDSQSYDPYRADNFVNKRMGGALGWLLPLLMLLPWGRRR